jgi:hypothetical protein
LSRFENEARARQLNDFNGLMTEGKMGATDIDGLVEYKNKAYMFLELKYQGKELPFGQKLALQRLVEDTGRSGKYSVALVIDHDVQDTNQNIVVAECFVREVYFFQEHKWRKLEQKLTTKQCIDRVIKIVNTGGH